MLRRDGWNFEPFLKQNESGSNLNTQNEYKKKNNNNNTRKYERGGPLELTTAGRWKKKKIDRPIVKRVQI
jgi:hypothetical protein